MKKFILEFLRRGLIAGGFGPIILAIVYLSLQKHGVIDSLSVNEVCLGIITVSALAFMVGGMNAIYQIEQLPLMTAILIHGLVLYMSYLATYLINGWLKEGKVSIWAFTGIFVLGYLVIWAIIYFVTKKKTDRLNEILKAKRGEINS